MSIVIGRGMRLSLSAGGEGAYDAVPRRREIVFCLGPIVIGQIGSKAFAILISRR
jgi:hypothetical protein